MTSIQVICCSVIYLVKGNTMLNIEDGRLILATLEKVKEKPSPSTGICKNFEECFYDKYPEDFWSRCTFLRLLNLVLTAAEQWPEYSGHRNYPVHTNLNVNPGVQYSRTWFHWARLTSYGRARRRLLDFLINHFEELVK